jgi:hypothetical protein
MEIQTRYGIISNAVSRLRAASTFGPKLSNNQPELLLQHDTHSLVDSSRSFLMYFEICSTVASATEFTHNRSIATTRIISASLHTQPTGPP